MKTKTYEMRDELGCPDCGGRPVQSRYIEGAYFCYCPQCQNTWIEDTKDNLDDLVKRIAMEELHIVKVL